MITVTFATLRAWHSAGLNIRIVRRVNGGAVINVGGLR